MRDVLQVLFDERVGGQDAVVQFGADKRVQLRAAIVEKEIGKPAETRGAQRRPIVLRPAPIAVVRGAVGIELRLPEPAAHR